MSVFTLEQAADYLRLSADELRVELESGRIPGLKVAGKWRIRQEILDRLLETPASAEQATTTVTSPDKPANGPEIAAPEPVPVQPAAEDQKGTVSVEARPPEDNAPSQSPASAPSVVVSMLPAPGRVRGSVFSYNPKEGFGYARLPDNRVVWLDSERLIQRMPAPFPGDMVEFELHSSRRGLVARAIQVIPKDKVSLPLSEPVQPGVPAPAREPKRTLPSASPLQPAARALKVPAPPEGTPKSQRLYQQAAVARTEGRHNDARRLFRQAIEAGAGTQVYSAYFKMELERGAREEARRIIQQAIAQFPDFVTFYEMYGQMERRARNYQRAEEIFRQGLARFPTQIGLRHGLAQTLVQLGTEDSFREAGNIFEGLEKQGKLYKQDGLYQRFQALQRSPRANRAYDFFGAAGMQVGIAGRRNLPWYITDIVTEIDHPELSESFGLAGSFLMRCFQRQPRQIEILDISRYLRGLGPQSVLGLQGGREVVLNPSLAFIGVPDSNKVRDQVMSILSDSNEAIVPLDDAVFRNTDDPVNTLRDLLGQYLGLRDLYSSTLPVSGRRFFGRERLLLQLTDEVHRGQFLGIYGLRKIGKTSLLYQLRDEKLRGDAVAYADLQASAALMMKSCAPLYWELERNLYLRLRERDQEGAELLRLGKTERFSDLPEDGAQAGLLFAEDMRALLDAMSAEEIPGVKHLVIVLDELERLLPVAGHSGINGYVEFFGLLRGLAQTDRYRGLLSSVVVAANAAISERGYWEGRENPVFALYKPVFLPPLSKEECVGMIRTLGRGMSVYWEDQAIQMVFAETGGHPFLARSLCSRITRQYPSRPLYVKASMVDEQIVPFIRDEGDKLEQITELLRTNFPEEEAALEQIAMGEMAGDTPDKMLRHLLGYQLIASENGGYRVTLNLLRRWLRRRAGIRE
jgi:excisionase family DNA binding protein